MSDEIKINTLYVIMKYVTVIWLLFGISKKVLRIKNVLPQTRW